MKPKTTIRKLSMLLLATLVVMVSFSGVFNQVFAQTTETEPEFYMGVLILESVQEKILDSIRKVKELQLGNTVVLHPLDQDWDLNKIEEAVRTADELGLYVTFETFDACDHAVRITPDVIGEWRAKYPHLMGVLVQEIFGKQIDGTLWESNSTGTITTRIEAEQAVIQNITTSMRLEEFEEVGAKIFLQENVISYAAANTSYCDVLMCKVFNAPNLELMIGLTRGMAKSYNIPEWGIWVDTWREWEKPPAFTPNDVERALYEGWFYGARYFFFEQGNFFGTLDRDWPTKFIVLNENGELTEYGKVLQRFYAFLKNQQSMNIEQPDYQASIAVMIGQSGWGSRGPNWGLFDQTDRYCDFDYRLLNLFFPGIGHNWQIGSALTGKEITGLPFGMVDVISIYTPADVLKQYDSVIGLGWSVMTPAIAANIDNYVKSGGVFCSFLSFTHSNPEVDELADPEAWINSYASTFGINVLTTPLNGADVSTDTYLHNITFTEDTFWFPWNTRTYSYGEPDEEGYWFWKFKYEIQDLPNTRVLAWINGEQSYPNAFIVENKNGEGYTYMINTRNAHSLPDGVLTDVLVDFLNFLCAYFVRPMIYVPYPETEYWLSQGQSDRAVYLIHDNSTETYTFQYYMRALEAGLVPGAEYLVFDYFNREFIGFVDDWMVSLNVTLNSNEGKVFVFLEDDNKPQVLYSDALLDSAMLSESRQLDIALEGVVDTTNTTTVYCSDFGQPRYILGLPYDLSQSYDPENQFLTLVTDSGVSVGWVNTTTYSVVSSTVALSDFMWNESAGTLTVSANGTTGHQATIKVQTGETIPDYVKVNGVEVSTWSHDETTGITTARFSFPAPETQLTFGFKAIGVDQTVVSNERADIGSVQTVNVHVAWMRDGSNVEGATVTVDNVEYLTDSTGWISFDVTQDSVGRKVYGVNKVEYNGLSDCAKVADDPQIIWDQINITNFKVFDGIVPSGSTQTVWLTAVYQFDYTSFDGSKGTVYFNGEPMVYSEQNLRWEHNITSNEAGPQTYEVTSVDDTVYGLSAVCSQTNNLTVTWDKVKITAVEYETPVLGKVKAKVHVKFSYTNNPVTGATVLVKDNECTETEQGVYICEVDDWGPVPTFLVNVEHSNFGAATKTVSSVHALNLLVYLVLGLAIVVTVVFVFKMKKGTKQHAQKS